MFNAYAIIIGLFILGGLATAVWGARLVARTRALRRWPGVEGVIETADPARPDDDLLPHIVFSYRVDGKTYRRAVEFPAGTLPTPELGADWLRKYPAGQRVTIHYDPQHPEDALLEPGRGGAGDWLVVALGAGAALIGLLMLLM
jgi:hypothetical protein